MTRERVSDWLRRYLDAWKSYDRRAIAALFSDDVVCRYHPYDEPIVGIDAVVESWLGEGDHPGAPGRDEAGTYDGAYEPVAIDGDVAVVTGVSSYTEGSGGPVTEVYDNCWIIRFDPAGRCREFTEWYMRRP